MRRRPQRRLAPLHTAAIMGHVDLIGRLLAGGRGARQALGARGGSPLSLALFYAKAGRVGPLADPPLPDNLRARAALNQSLERFFEGDGLRPQAADGNDFYRPSLVFPVWERTNRRQELLDEALSWAAERRLRRDGPLCTSGANVTPTLIVARPYLGHLYRSRGRPTGSRPWADPTAHDFGDSTRLPRCYASRRSYGCVTCCDCCWPASDPQSKSGVRLDAAPLQSTTRGRGRGNPVGNSLVQLLDFIASRLQPALNHGGAAIRTETMGLARSPRRPS